jgi:hypothetical protein
MIRLSSPDRPAITPILRITPIPLKRETFRIRQSILKKRLFLKPTVSINKGDPARELFRRACDHAGIGCNQSAERLRLS